MEPKKKKLPRLAGIMLCALIIVICGVICYLCNYNLKIWYSLQNAEVKQEVCILMNRYITLSNQYCEHSEEQIKAIQEREELVADLAQAKAKYEKFQEDYGADCYGVLQSEYDELKRQYEDLQRQSDDLDKKYREWGLLMEYKLSLREEIGDEIRELGFRGQPRKFEMEEIMNNT